jgi:cytochrome c553
MRFARWALAALTACSAFASAANAEGDPAVGRQKAYTCFGCHGVPGYTNAYPTYRVPRLGGQNADYIVAALKEYKSGDRSHKTMHAQASVLSDQDMADIAAYMSTAPHVPKE